MSSRFTVESAARWVEEAVEKVPEHAKYRVNVETFGAGLYVTGFVTTEEYRRYNAKYCESSRALAAYCYANDAFRFSSFIHDENQANNYFKHVLEMYAPFDPTDAGPTPRE